MGHAFLEPTVEVELVEEFGSAQGGCLAFLDVMLECLNLLINERPLVFSESMDLLI